MNVWKRRCAMLLLFIPLGLAACGEEVQDTDVEGPGLLDEPEPLNAPEGGATMETASGPEVLLVSPFQAAPAAEGAIDGSVRLMVPEVGEPEGVTVQARVAGLSEGPHAWHIHAGPCGERAPVVVAFTPTAEMQALDQPLVAGPDGVAEESAFIPETLLSLERISAGDYSVHVHRQGGVEHGPTVACANL